jgi:hypothetical protein
MSWEAGDPFEYCTDVINLTNASNDVELNTDVEVWNTNTESDCWVVAETEGDGNIDVWLRPNHKIYFKFFQFDSVRLGDASPDHTGLQVRGIREITPPAE